LVAIILVVLVTVTMGRPKFSGSEILGFLGVVVVLIATLSIATCPIHGYEDRVLSEEIELATLSIDGQIVMGDLKYVSASGTEIYSYKVKGENKVSVIGSISNGKIECIELEKCEKATLRVYERKAKKSWFSLSSDVKQEYEFIVPINGVQQIS
jgi:hypothetical protein